MRIGLHITLMFFLTLIGLWTFGFGSGWLLAWLDAMRAWPLILLAASIGAALGPAAGKRIAARCPTCGGRAYYELGELGARIGTRFPIKYRCAECGDVHFSGVSEGR
jgi:hypothetical protein